MATVTVFNQTSYFRVNGACDRHLIENYLLPGLESQGRISAGSRGIELPSPSQRPEYITLEEAKRLVIEYLDSTENLLTKDKKVLLSIDGFAEFARYAQLVYSNRIVDPHKLLNATRISNLETYRKQQALKKTTPIAYDTGKVFDDYNHLYFKLLKYSQSGVPGNILSSLVPQGLDQNQSNLTKLVLAQIICRNLDRLHSAGSVGVSDEVKDFAVTKELFRIVRNEHPDASGLLNFINDRQAGSVLRAYVGRVKTGFFDNSATSLKDYKKKMVAASTSSSDFIPGQQALLLEIGTALPTNLTQKERSLIAQTIISEIISSSPTPLTSDQILIIASKKAAKKLGLKDINTATLSLIRRSLRESGLDAVIEYRQNEMSLLVNGHALTRAEIKLLKSGINPFYSFKTQFKLGLETSRIINDYNKTNNLTGNSKLSTLEAIEKHELESPSPRLSLIRKIRSLKEHNYFYSNLTEKQKRLLKRTQFGRFMLELRSGLAEAQRIGWDKWFDFEDLITGKKLFTYLSDGWEKYSSTTTIPGTKIPLFKFFPWITDQIKNLKKTYVKSIIAQTKNSGGFGSLVNWTFRQYELGGYTYNGALAHIRKAAWSSVIKWGIAKVGMTSAFKYASVSTRRTVTRILLKIGGRALARSGSEAVLALLSALSGVGIVITILSTIQIVAELFKAGWSLVKEFFTNTSFRENIIIAGATVAGIILTIPAAIFGILSGITALVSGAFINLLVAFVISIVLPFSAGFIQHNIRLTTRLDVGSSLTQIVTNALCTLTGSTPDPNSTPAANAGQCIYEFLNQFSINPLTASNAKGSAWDNFAAALGNATAASIIQTSATGQGVFQCVGYIAGVGAMIGKPFNPTNACLYVNNPPGGYTWTSKPTPGCFFVIGSNTCSQCGKPNAPANSCGHVGVVVSVKGAIIEGSDANGTSPWGSVRVGAQFPTSSIAGYMCP